MVVAPPFSRGKRFSCCWHRGDGNNGKNVGEGKLLLLLFFPSHRKVSFWPLPSIWNIFVPLETREELLGKFYIK